MNVIAIGMNMYEYHAHRKEGMWRYITATDRNSNEIKTAAYHGHEIFVAVKVQTAHRASPLRTSRAHPQQVEASVQKAAPGKISG